MKNYILRFLHGIDAINERAGKGISFLALCMIGILCWEVLLRYVFNAPTIWAHEVSCHIFAAYSVLGGAYVLLVNEHVRSDVVYARFSPRGRAILDLVTFPLFFMLLGIILVEGIPMALSSIEVREVTVSFLHSPVYPIKTCIPIAAFLMLLQGLAHFIRALALVITGRELR